MASLPFDEFDHQGVSMNEFIKGREE